MITKQVWSAGGVVIQRGDAEDDYEVVICGRTLGSHWGLPKGTPEPDEDAPATARREVREETGIDAEILAEVGVTDYTFYRQEAANGSAAATVKYEKRVFFYVMKPLSGSFNHHDHEYDIIEWENWNGAIKRLTHASEAQIVKKSIQICRDQKLI